MRLTNRQGLPEVVVRLVSGPDRPPEMFRISVTELIKPPQMRALEMAHEDEIVEDVADRLWAAYGTMMHLAIERIGGDNVLQEERLEADFDGVTVHGTPDLYEQDGVLTDFKYTSVWATRDGIKADWEAQVNCYAWLLWDAGFVVREANVIAMYRDWSKRERSRYPDYPDQVQKLPVRLWPVERQEDYIRERVRLHMAAPGLCTPADRWERPTQWAVAKRGQERARRLLATEDDAKLWAERNTPPNKQTARWFEISERPGESVRCAEYCRVRAFCQQRQAEIEACPV